MSRPLADRLRPKELSDMVGQPRLLSQGSALRKIIDSGKISNMIFYGPSGVGKTTLASIIASKTDKKLYKLNATTASTSNIREVFEQIDTIDAMNGILLYLDEIQYFNKKQQQSLLEFIEDGSITLIASTTENPYFYIYGALLSRCTVFQFESVSAGEICKAVNRAADFLSKENGVSFSFSDGADLSIAQACGGDVRRAINITELCALSAENGIIDNELVQQFCTKGAMYFDRDGDTHYDILSAFQKSLRGSDPDAALHYLARLLEGGDMISACRRLLVCACEDVGLAYPQIIPIVKACVDSAHQLGLPEARIPLADAVVLVATSPKSNTAYMGINMAMDDVRSGRVGDIPAYLKDSHYSGAEKLGRGKGYVYPHDCGGWVQQQYLPDLLKNRKYYQFGNNKNERAAELFWEKVKGNKKD
ncbi:MAG: replication-associated recombination protein A [Clostridia bacterium]|nr:replication-associated recombination protein A [Clostridia bacterium]